MMNKTEDRCEVRAVDRMMYYSLNDDHIKILMDICLEHTQHG